MDGTVAVLVSDGKACAIRAYRLGSRDDRNAMKDFELRWIRTAARAATIKRFGVPLQSKPESAVLVSRTRCSTLLGSVRLDFRLNPALAHRWRRIGYGVYRRAMLCRVSRTTRCVLADILAQHAVHAPLPAVAGAAEVRDDFRAVPN